MRLAVRPLTPGEAALARSVFGEAIDYARVRILVRPGAGYAVVLGSVITFPELNARADFSDAPLQVQAWFVHEMTHVWQFQTAPLRTLASWAKTVLTGGYGPGAPAYRYALPVERWDRLGLEQQASVVEHAFLLRRGFKVASLPAGALLQDYAGRTPFEGLE